MGPGEGQSELKKHGISFRQAVEVFRGPLLVTEDNRHDYGEHRYIALGEYDGEVICIIYTERDRDIRIISAWKAGHNDREAYTQYKQAGKV
jgi:hypothetical protein